MSTFDSLTKQRSQTVGLILIAFSLLLGACSKTAQGVEMIAEPKQVMIETQGNQLTFDKSILRAQSSERIELTLKNNSTAFVHNWVLVDGEEKVADQVYQEALAAGEKNTFLPNNAADLLIYTKFVARGEQNTISFTAPTVPGNYMFLCTYPGHYLAGMKGTLTVSAP